MFFNLISEKLPSNDQKKCIEFFCNNYNNTKNQTLLGITGSGKTFTIANVINKLQIPSLILAPNKTLASQLYSEFKDLFPNNHVEYFVSYYDYYQPESYIPRTDVYIEKEATINETIDQMRHSATSSLITYKDVIVVASVSCIYGIGEPEHYKEMLCVIKINEPIAIKMFTKRLVDMHYSNSPDFRRGSFRVIGDIIDIYPSNTKEKAIRIETFDNVIESIRLIDPVSGKKHTPVDQFILFPNSHYVTPKEIISRAINEIENDLKKQEEYFRSINKITEATRIHERVMFDLEMIQSTGTCKGIENYSGYLSGRKCGATPPTIFEYMPKNSLLIVDESHISVPQIRAMYNGDYARKSKLVEYGFRLPRCLDNRPLKFEEWYQIRPQTIFVSATPGDFERQISHGYVAEQIIRPTGILDPEVIVNKTANQMDVLINNINETVNRGERVLITTLTKRSSESLTKYLAEMGYKVLYLHSEIHTLERINILAQLISGELDILVGINMLREGLDIPECSLVAILDADKEGFLRSKNSLIQTIGRAARNINGRVLLFADTETASMREAINETNRRRKIQKQYNKDNNIIPTMIHKRVSHEWSKNKTILDTHKIKELKREMLKLAENLEFEKAAKIRDYIKSHS